MGQASDAPQEYEIEWTKTAQQSLNQIVAYIAKDKPLAAENFRQEVLQHVGLLKTAPQLGRIVPEYGNPIRRELLHGSYRIIYRVHLRLRKVQITLIWHGKRLLPRG